mgnify:CR=1 FL=1
MHVVWYAVCGSRRICRLRRPARVLRECRGRIRELLAVREGEEDERERMGLRCVYIAATVWLMWAAKFAGRCRVDGGWLVGVLPF